MTGVAACSAVGRAVGSVGLAAGRGVAGAVYEAGLAGYETGSGGAYCLAVGRGADIAAGAAVVDVC